MLNSNLKLLKEKVWKCNMELYNKGLIVHTFGNVSGIDRDEGIIAIKPSGIPYSELTVDKIVLVDLSNKVVDSKYKPSSDTKTHLVLYNNFSKIGGVVHTHSSYATSWAQANKSIPCTGTTHADYIQGDISCTEILSDEQIKGDYEIETGNQIVKIIPNDTEDKINMILVAGHGPFTWGETPEKAVYNTVILEEIAKITMYTLLLNPNIKQLNKALLNKHYNRKHGEKSYYGQ